MDGLDSPVDREVAFESNGLFYNSLRIAPLGRPVLVAIMNLPLRSSS